MWRVVRSLPLLLLLLLQSLSSTEGAESCASPAPRTQYAAAVDPDGGRRPPGSTRARSGQSYALLAPDNRVYGAPVPGWAGPVSAAALVTPALGAHFAMYLVRVRKGGEIVRPTGFEGVIEGLERIFFVLTGEVRVDVIAGEEELLGMGKGVLGPGAFLYAGPGDTKVDRLVVEGEAVLIQLDRVYAGSGSPRTVVGDVETVAEEVPEGEVFRLRRLLDTDDAAYDFNIHVMDFSPGEFLAIKERHYNQHGLLMLEGEGLYMLGEDFMPVQAGDAIWMAPFCAQWYAALGKTRSRYWLYKDTNVDPLLRDLVASTPFSR